MTPEQLVAESVETLRGAWGSFARRFPGGRIEPLDGVSLLWADVPLSFLNMALLDTPCPDAGELRRRLDGTLAHLADAPHPWLACLCEEWVSDDWREVVEAAGLHVLMPMTGMVTEQLEPPRREPPSLDLRRVREPADRRSVGSLNDAAYVMPPGSCDCVLEPGFWPDDMYGALGATDGVDVSTATVFPVDDILYVALVATHPDHGRKGYAEHVMRHAVEQGGAELGLKRTLLHASEAGRPIYAAMGYAETSRFALLSTEPPPEH